jgi:hypothetical protein
VQYGQHELLYRPQSCVATPGVHRNEVELGRSDILPNSRTRVDRCALPFSRLLAAVASFRVLIALSALNCSMEEHVSVPCTCGLYAMF